MLVRILIDGESPDFGPLKRGAERVVPMTIGQVMIARGIAEVVNKTETIKPKTKTEVKGDGR